MNLADSIPTPFPHPSMTLSPAPYGSIVHPFHHSALPFTGYSVVIFLAIALVLIGTGALIGWWLKRSAP